MFSLRRQLRLTYPMARVRILLAGARLQRDGQKLGSHSEGYQDWQLSIKKKHFINIIGEWDLPPQQAWVINMSDEQFQLSYLVFDYYEKLSRKTIWFYSLE